MSQREYTQKSIETIASMVREKMGLSVPIQLTELKESIRKMGIKVTPDTHLTDTLSKHAPYDYEIFYNPNWNEQTQLFQICTALGSIMLFGLKEDSEKDIYTGTYICLDESGKTISETQIFRHATNMSENILRCEDPDDLIRMLHNYVKDEPCINYHIFRVYDFYNESMIKIQKSGIGETVYFVKFAKKEITS